MSKTVKNDTSKTTYNVVHYWMGGWCNQYCDNLKKARRWKRHFETDGLYHFWILYGKPKIIKTTTRTIITEEEME